jgi:hypothetical protein
MRGCVDGRLAMKVPNLAAETFGFVSEGVDVGDEVEVGVDVVVVVVLLKRGEGSFEGHLGHRRRLLGVRVVRVMEGLMLLWVLVLGVGRVVRGEAEMLKLLRRQRLDELGSRQDGVDTTRGRQTNQSDALYLKKARRGDELTQTEVYHLAVTTRDRVHPVLLVEKQETRRRRCYASSSRREGK